MSSTSSGSTRNSKHTAGGMEQRHKAKVHNNSKSKKKEKVKKDKKTNSKKASKDTVAKSNKMVESSLNNDDKPQGACPPRETAVGSMSELTITSGLEKLSLNRTPNSAATENRRVMRRAQSVPGRLDGASLSEIAQGLCGHQIRSVVVMVGAGISTASGIPDFRTPGSGLYDNLKQYNIPTPQHIFDIDFFDTNPRPFFELARELYPGRYHPNLVHFFLRLLYEKGVLRRIYTQNIDGLELVAGVPAEKLVEAHGSFRSASCVRCQRAQSASDTREAIFSNKIPRCKAKKCWGLVKPDIVFFGEDLPRRFYYYLSDFPQADLVLVLGTSLEVQPFAGILDIVGSRVPRVLFNKNAVGPFRKKCRAKDITIEGDIVKHIQQFCELLGWKSDLDQLIKVSEGKVQRELVKLSVGDGSVPSTSSCAVRPPRPPLGQRPRPSSHAGHVSRGPAARLPTHFANMNNANSLVGLQSTDSMPPIVTQQRVPSFHAQTTLYRTNGGHVPPQPRLRPLSSDSSDSSDSSSDTSDYES